MLEDHGVSFKAKNACDQAEFLASTDERFRPVNLNNGPDGCLYIVDMYHGILQHHLYVTSYLRQQMLDRGLDPQQAAEAPNITSYQMRSSFDAHQAKPGKLTLNDSVPPWVRTELGKMGYELDIRKLTSGPINAIFFDRKHGTMWGGSSNYGEDYGIAW